MIRLAPSILTADFANLESEIGSIVQGPIDLLHLDVMDGHFVPNMTFGPPIIKAIKRVTSCELDVHLMISNPDDWVEAFVEAGADYLSVHAEVTPHLHRTIQAIQAKGAKAGVALNPGTSLEAIQYVLPDVDFILIMTVNPGFGGQSFISQMLDKIRDLKARLKDIGREIPIEVDGGINVETIGKVREAGASWFVSGSAIVNQPNRAKAIEALIHACQEGNPSL